MRKSTNEKSRVLPERAALQKCIREQYNLVQEIFQRELGPSRNDRGRFRFLFDQAEIIVGDRFNQDTAPLANTPKLHPESGRVLVPSIRSRIRHRNFHIWTDRQGDKKTNLFVAKASIMAPAQFPDFAATTQYFNLERGINRPVALIGEYGVDFSAKLVMASYCLMYKIALAQEQLESAMGIIETFMHREKVAGAITSTSAFQLLTQGVSSSTESISLLTSYKLPRKKATDIFEFFGSEPKNVKLIAQLSQSLAFAHLAGAVNVRRMALPEKPLEFVDGRYQLTPQWIEFLERISVWKTDPDEVFARFGRPLPPSPLSVTTTAAQNEILGNGCPGISIAPFLIPALWQWYLWVDQQVRSKQTIIIT